MTLIADASPLILLGKISLLTKLLEKNKLIIPEKVYLEVIKGKEKGFLDAFLVERLVKEGKIKIEKVDKKIYEKIWKLFGLWAGEAEALGLALKTKCPLITDDKKCLNASKATNIKVITSLDVVISLFKKKQIDKNKALKALRMLEEYGWYKNDIIKFYRGKIKK